MGVLDRIAAYFRRDIVARTALPTSPPPRPSQLIEAFSAEHGRRAIVEEARRMAEDDPRVKGILETLARDTVKTGFALTVDGPRAQEAERVALELFDRLNFQDRLERWVKSTLRDGDTFLEVLVNTNLDVVDLSRKPTLEMHRNSDEFDRFADSAKAFFWTDKLWSGSEPPADAVWFAEWQVIHARYQEDDNQRYGRPLLTPARSAYKRMREGELDIAIRRKTRAGMRYVHSIEEGSEAEIERYIERNRPALDDPFAAVQDFFSSKRTSVQSIQGDANLNEIEDVLHHIRTFWIASPVPMALLGYGQDLNRDVLDEQKEQYDAAKEQLAAWAAYQFIYPLVERQWLLRGILPGSLTYAVEWTAKQALTAPDLQAAAQAVVALQASGLLTPETLLQLLGRFVPDLDVQAELEAVEQRIEDEAARLAVNAGVGGADDEEPDDREDGAEETPDEE